MLATLDCTPTVAGMFRMDDDPAGDMRVILAERANAFRQRCTGWLTQAGFASQVWVVRDAQTLARVGEEWPMAFLLTDPALLQALPPPAQSALLRTRRGLVFRSEGPWDGPACRAPEMSLHLPRAADPETFEAQWRLLTTPADRALLNGALVGEILGLVPARAAAHLRAFNTETALLFTEMAAGLASGDSSRHKAAHHALRGCAAALGAAALAVAPPVKDTTDLDALREVRRRTLARLALVAAAYGIRHSASDVEADADTARWPCGDSAQVGCNRGQQPADTEAARDTSADVWLSAGPAQDARRDARSAAVAEASTASDSSSGLPDKTTP